MQYVMLEIAREIPPYGSRREEEKNAGKLSLWIPNCIRQKSLMSILDTRCQQEGKFEVDCRGFHLMPTQYGKFTAR